MERLAAGRNEFELAFAPRPRLQAHSSETKSESTLRSNPIIDEQTPLGISPRAHLRTNRDHHSNPKIRQFSVFASRQDSGPSATPLKKTEHLRLVPCKKVVWFMACLFLVCSLSISTRSSLHVRFCFVGTCHFTSRLVSQ